MHSLYARAVYSDNSDYRHTVCNDVRSVDKLLVSDSGSLPVNLSLGSAVILIGLDLSVLSECGTHIGTIYQSSLQTALDSIEGRFWLGGPMMGYNRCYTAEGEQSSLMSGLLIRHIMLRSQNVPIDHGLVGIHSIHNDHGSALGEYREVAHEGRRELVDKGSH